MKLVLIVSLLVMSLALNAQTIQGKVVRVADGDIVSLREDPNDIVRKRPKGCEGLEDCEVMEAYWIGGYLLNSNGEYKYLFDKGRWYVVSGLCEIDGVTPIQRLIPIAQAIEIWSR